MMMTTTTTASSPIFCQAFTSMESTPFCWSAVFISISVHVQVYSTVTRVTCAFLHQSNLVDQRRSRHRRRRHWTPAAAVELPRGGTPRSPCGPARQRRRAVSDTGRSRRLRCRLSLPPLRAQSPAAHSSSAEATASRISARRRQITSRPAVMTVLITCCCGGSNTLTLSDAYCLSTSQ